MILVGARQNSTEKILSLADGTLFTTTNNEILDLITNYENALIYILINLIIIMTVQSTYLIKTVSLK